MPVPARISTFYRKNNQKTIGLTSISSAVKNKNKQFLLRASEFRLLGILSSALRGMDGAPAKTADGARGLHSNPSIYAVVAFLQVTEKDEIAASFHQGFLALAGSQ